MSKPLDDGLGSIDHPIQPEPMTTKYLDAEADHRIANSLVLVASLLKTQARDIGERPMLTGSEARAVLEESAARIDAVGNLHRLLATPMSDAGNVAVHLTQITENARSFATSAGNIRTIYDFGPHLRLDPRRLNALGLFVGEVIVNSFKHAHPASAPGEIRVSCRQIDAFLVLVIEDDGVGFRPGFKPEIHGGTGFKVMAALASQLSAQVTRKSTPLGLWTEILFPL
ncbi:MAG: sensor histidine kinase [Terricaulis sp.]